MKREKEKENKQLDYKECIEMYPDKNQFRNGNIIIIYISAAMITFLK